MMVAEVEEVQEDVSVLIVEDERIVAKDIEHTIRDLGYRSAGIASSCDKALELAQRVRPTIVLMDIRIKGPVDGVETAVLLRKFLDVPVIFLTAHADTATLARAAQTSPYGYLLKPVRSSDIQSAIAVGLVKFRLERESRQREQWHSTLLQSIADAVVAIDAECRVTFMNKGAETMCGLAEKVALGQELRDVLRLLDEDGEIVDYDDECQTLLRGTAMQSSAGRLENHSTGASVFIERSSAPVIDRGEVLGAVMVLHDMTADHKVQKRLELAERLASLGTMAAGVAHEVNNPLTVVSGNTSLLVYRLRALHTTISEVGGTLSTQLADIADMEQACSDTLEAANRIRDIVRALGSFSRPKATEPGDVASAIAWAAHSTSHLLRHRARIEIEQVAVPLVVIDKTKLGQIFVNLLSNAADAIRAGDMENNVVRIEVTQAEPDSVQVTISDTGAGMPASVIRHVLEPFFTTKDVGRGTGLGLSITHHLVTAVGGHFDIRSEEGIGTIIVLDIPVAPPPPASTFKLTSVPKSAAKLRILFIDDQDSVRVAVGRLLSSHTVFLSSDGANALERIGRGEEFDLILCDVMMPMMTGEQFLEQVTERFPRLVDRIVFVTGGAIGRHETMFLENTTHRIIQKPFELDELERVVSCFQPKE
tara:strand:- start:28167 stop:30116 length:1950 start_codon:yes stop_codon:yes gene_type:complete